jgi:EAL domain-containing protein (putative c-di-GMP-specific phosphodiesterase class I)/ActR/RegA family two-component response regulator
MNKRRDSPTVRPSTTRTQPSPDAGHVLVVEDDDALARAMSRYLQTAGYRVDVAADGSAAADLVLRGSYDAVVSDINLPGATGLDLLRTIRAYDLDLPVVLNTADPTVQTAAEAVEFGAIQYLVKPVERAVLIDVVGKAVGLHRIARLKREALRMLGGDAESPGDRAGLSSRFDKALEGLHIAFQPIVDLKRGSIFGYEALMRSAEPSLPSPLDVVHAAERLDRIYEMGARVRELAIRSFAELDDRDITLFINLHTSELLDASIYSETSPLHRFADRVILEVTERTAIEKIQDVRARASVLRFHGFRLAIDDLGAGYAGLTSFVTLEPDIVKLDMTLVRGIDSSEMRQQLVRSVVDLCHRFKMRVVAEGVETGRELSCVRLLGCDFAQGYYLGRPNRAFVSSFAMPES